MANFLPLPTRSRRTCRFQEILTRKFALASNNATQHNRVQAPFITGGARLQTRPPHSLLLLTFQTKHYGQLLKLTNNLQIICKLVATHTILQIRCGPPVSWGIGRIVGEGRVVLQALKSLQGCARAYRLCWESRRGDRRASRAGTKLTSSA